MASPEPIPGRCGAKVFYPLAPGEETRRFRGYCERPPMTEQTRCGSHGGKAKQNVKAALARIERKKTEVEFARLGMIDRIDDPIGAMHDRVSESVAWLDHLRSKLPDDGNYATWSGETGEQAKVVVKLYVEALQMAHKFLESWIRLDMDGRRLKFDEAQARATLERVVAVIDQACDQAGLTAQQKDAVKRAIGGAL
jgi:hypothetical protein